MNSSWLEVYLGTEMLRLEKENCSWLPELLTWNYLTNTLYTITFLLSKLKLLHPIYFERIISMTDNTL